LGLITEDQDENNVSRLDLLIRPFPAYSGNFGQSFRKVLATRSGKYWSVIPEMFIHSEPLKMAS
jgi:hypothetical protein